jgi:phosphatidyl-myo-inositol dimannoside synthase
VPPDAAHRDLDLLWLALPGSRPWREPFWLSQMPGARVTVVGDRPTGDPVEFVRRPYRQVTRRFVEAGALAWLRDLDTLPPHEGPGPAWVAALELCPLVTGQAAALATRRGAGLAVLTWGNDPRHPLYSLPPYRQALGRARRADLFVCTIEAARAHCVALGIPEERCEVVLPGVDTELFHPPDAPVAEPVAVFCSPLAPNKGIDRVLDAFARVRERQPDARLVVAGRGPLEGLVREHEAASAGAVRLVGALDRDGVAALLRASAVFVTAPRANRVWNEQFGLAYVEAMACGLPVVTTACGTNHEAVLPPNVLVPDDAGDLADALGALLASPTQRAEVGRANRAIVLERFELRTQVAALRAAFDAHR